MSNIIIKRKALEEEELFSHLPMYSDRGTPNFSKGPDSSHSSTFSKVKGLSLYSKAAPESSDKISNSE
jgi:hypothetical protein